jgi:small subunit ribosomal protein S8
MSGITDPIADMLTRIRNAGTAQHSNVLVPASNIKVELGRVLKEEGFIRDYEIVRGQRFRVLRLHLLYDEHREPLIRGIKRASTPGRRFYVGKSEIPRIFGGQGVAIITTPQGVMTGRQARQRGVGGEVLCYLW